MPRIAQLLFAFLIAVFAGLSAFGQPPTPVQPPKLTLEQQEKLKVRNRLFEEAQELQSEGKFAAARKTVEKCLAIELEVFGENHLEVAVTLELLTYLSLRAEDFPAARENAQRALTVRKKLHGESHWQTIDARLKLADVELRAGLSKKQRDELAEASRLRMEERDFSDRGEYQKAREYAEKCVAIYRAVLGEKHRLYAISLNRLATIYRLQGLFEKAEPLYREDLAITKELLGVKHPDYGHTLTDLGLVYSSKGMFVKAEPLFKETLALTREVLGAKHADYATCVNNLAYLYDSQNLFEKAEPLYKEALAIYREVLGVKHPTYALTLNNLAGLYFSQEKYAKAEPLFQEALAVKKEALGDRHPDYAVSLNSLAVFYRSQGMFEKSERLQLEALAIYKEVLGTKHPYYATSLLNLAHLYILKGLIAKAEPLCKEALAITKEALGVKHPDYASCLRSLAHVCRAQGSFEKAAALYLEAIAIIEDHLEETAAIESESDQLTYMSLIRFYLEYLLLLEGTKPADVYAASFRWRGVVTARQAFARAARAMDPAVQQTLDELRAVSLQLSELVNKPPRPGLSIGMPERRKALYKKRDDLEQKLADQSKDIAKYREYRTHTPADVQKLLPPNAALIDFLAFGDSIAAFIITPKAIVRVDLKGGSDLDGMVNEFRSTLSLKRTRPVQGEDDNSILYKTIWEPLLPHLGDASLILICPDGPLCQLPFAALRGKDPKKYLIEEVSLAVVPVPGMLFGLLASKPASPNAASSLLAIGDVDFGAGLPWKPLAGTKSEIETIEKLYRKGIPTAAFKSLTRGNATGTAIRNIAGEYRYLHFATHGFFDSSISRPQLEGRGAELFGERNRMPVRNPNLLCGLVCAGANKPKPDDVGKLTALEIMDLDLSGVELAVLSACETGLGKIINGDGVLGLQRSFQLAGARTTVTSLWQVPDAATSALMIRFYENKLKKGMPTLEALQEAQLWVLNEGVEAGVLTEAPKNGRRTPPLYWAAFTLAGDWR